MPSRRPSATLQDIADRCGVTKAAVSLALTGHPGRVSLRLRRRIAAAARRLGYDAARHHHARQLSLRRHGKSAPNQVVAAFLPPDAFVAAYYRDILRELLAALQAEHVGLLVNYDNSSEVGRHLLPPFSQGGVDGAIIMANARLFAPVVRRLRRLAGFGARPLVSLIQPLAGCSAVLADDRTASRAALRHLLDLGHRRILHFYWDAATQPESAVGQRWLGFLDACADVGVRPGAVLVASPWERAHREQSQALLRAALQAHPDVTAIFAANDPGAIWVAETLHELGRRIPGDLSLVGYDDVEPLFLNGSRANALTTVHVPLGDLGRAGARLLLEHVRAASPPTRVVLPATLVVRGSTAPPRPSS